MSVVVPFNVITPSLIEYVTPACVVSSVSGNINKFLFASTIFVAPSKEVAYFISPTLSSITSPLTFATLLLNGVLYGSDIINACFLFNFLFILITSYYCLESSFVFPKDYIIMFVCVRYKCVIV